MAFKFISKLFSGGSGGDNPQYTMGMHQKKQGSFGSNVQSSQSSQPKPTFGQDRAQKMEQRLNSAIKERQQLFRAQASADSSVKDHLDRRSQMVENKIDRLRSATASDSDR